ncbi:hypothetical protein JX266_006569 [Neoarthrinium moseri]|uniref:uncharacterized protein n=1 Tax=Neoarthrinium moseri TaxID=1658444 RepID=UPI001FDE0609|nr:uncharacterized protein JN550_010322 [Neoarthrinium moseri]KAI1847344.1 hypothetical protein JX266_006569 [Neoarthrinium moseri]KAI1862315.1 hypothetical protein JN550_010322 [Neoarthrinium moseri]
MSDLTTVIAKGIAPPVGPYSHAVKTPTAIYCSGQIHFDANGQLIPTTDVKEMTKQCLENLKAVLAEAGSSLDKIVKTTVFLVDMDHFAQVNEVYAQYITHKPARSCVAVKTLPKGATVEIEAVALP